MAWYKRSKLGFNTFSSCFFSKTPTQNAVSFINTNRLSKFPSSTSYLFRVPRPAIGDRNLGFRFLGSGYRNYHFGHVMYPNPQRIKKLFFNRKTCLIVLLVGSGIYYGTVETIPYTKRKHIVLWPSQKLEKEMVDLKFKKMKATTYKGKILPATHPDSVRIRMISEKIVDALKRRLQKEQIGTDLNYTLEGGALMRDENVSGGDKWFGKEQVWTDLNYASEGGIASEMIGKETLMEMTEDSFGDVDKWMRKDEVINDMWVDQSREKGKDSRINLATAHLEGLDWEVLVVNDNVVKVECVPGGKIVVSTGLLNHFRTDEEIATIISHEVAHEVARHKAEMRNLLLIFMYLGMLSISRMTGFVVDLPYSLLRLRKEIEADHIGLILMSSAGYDPRIAVNVLEKLSHVGDDSASRNYCSYHPSSKKRSKSISKASVMQEALAIYQDPIEGRKVDGFLL